MYRVSFFLLVFGCAGMFVQAQDTTKRRTIDITSSFKPVLRDAVKINFNAAPPAVDTSRPRLAYNIPAQYLFLNYQPGEMKPVALQRDSVKPWENYNYIKVGVGNVHIPYIRTGFSFGDGRSTFFNLFANQLSSKGNLPFQKNSLTDVKFVGTVKTASKLEWSGGLGFKNDVYYRYGFRPDTLKFTSDQLKLTYQTYEGQLSLRNTEPTEFGLLYHPNIKVNVFSANNNPDANEVNTVLNLPLEKTIGDNYAFDLGFTANLTHYHEALTGVTVDQNNNIYMVNPAFLVKTSNLFLQAAVTPSWDQKVFHLLPNFLADISTSDQRFTVQLGWIGYYDKGSYQRFQSINPWLAAPDSLLNTRVQEWYGGFKGSISNHFSYAAKIGFQQYKNMALFVNDSAIAKNNQFDVRYEPSMDALQLHGELSYIVGDEFSATAGVNLYDYRHLKVNAKAYGLLPIEFNTHLKWQAFKDFWAKVDFFAFGGARYLTADGNALKGNSGADLNAGVEFKILKQLNLWFQMNNVFNNKYERWHQYPVYGFNVLGGVVFTFGQK
jgi:hypothetical protein